LHGGHRHAQGIPGHPGTPGRTSRAGSPPASPSARRRLQARLAAEETNRQTQAQEHAREIKRLTTGRPCLNAGTRRLLNEPAIGLRNSGLPAPASGAAAADAPLPAIPTSLAGSTTPDTSTTPVATGSTHRSTGTRRTSLIKPATARWPTEFALAARRAARPAGRSASHRLDCGEPIPEARQQAVPGVTLCGMPDRSRTSRRTHA
jgi:hypothetical protein